jgi:hypothetical protein
MQNVVEAIGHGSGGLDEELDHFPGMRVEFDRWAATPTNLQVDLVSARRYGNFDGFASADLRDLLPPSITRYFLRPSR